MHDGIACVSFSVLLIIGNFPPDTTRALLDEFEIKNFFFCFAPIFVLSVAIASYGHFIGEFILFSEHSWKKSLLSCKMLSLAKTKLLCWGPMDDGKLHILVVWNYCIIKLRHRKLMVKIPSVITREFICATEYVTSKFLAFLQCHPWLFVSFVGKYVIIGGILLPSLAVYLISPG